MQQKIQSRTQHLDMALKLNNNCSQCHKLFTRTGDLRIYIKVESKYHHIFLFSDYLSCDDFEGTFQDLMFKVQPIQVLCRGVLPSIRPES
jgi:hypothetical protein